MRLTLAVRTLGILLLLFAAALILPLLISFVYMDGQQKVFAFIASISALTGLLILRMLPSQMPTLRTRDGFIIVSIFWMVVSLIGSLPLILALDLGLAAAFFESASALTTTGATVIIGLDYLPKSILFYRQEMQWLGGVGIIVSAVALLPMLGVGGMQLFKAETAGPMKDDKLTPRLYHAARNLWVIYAAMTLICAFLYWLGGMTTFDAISHSLSTVSTGGFSTHDASFGFFDSLFLETVAIVFMLLGSISFNVHFFVMSRGAPALYWKNVEARTFLIVSLITALFITLYLTHQGGELTEFPMAFRLAVFQTVSVISSTGFGIDDFSMWPGMLPMLLIGISFLGGCAGSTAGGMKIIRYIILFKFMNVLLKRHVHPNIQASIMLESKVITGRVVDSIGAFFVLYFATFVTLILVLMANDLDFITAFSAVATCLNNLGPGLGEIAANFQGMNGLTHVLMGITMILGRLELFTILVLLSPAMWRF